MANLCTKQPADHTGIRPADKYCYQCGALVRKGHFTCAKCGAELEPHQEFCSDCGSKAGEVEWTQSSSG